MILNLLSPLFCLTRLGHLFGGAKLFFSRSSTPHAMWDSGPATLHVYFHHLRVENKILNHYYNFFPSCTGLPGFNSRSLLYFNGCNNFVIILLKVNKPQ